MQENICHFIPFHGDYDSIHTINFVLETKPQIYDHLKSESVYKMYYVSSGSGNLHTTGRISALSEGDVFFTFPASPFQIESVRDFTYMYISFTGFRGNMILEKLKISNRNFLFHDAQDVCPLWQYGLSVNTEFTDLMSESVLLYTFAFLGNQLAPDNTAVKHNNTAALIKKYIDDHFTDTDFSIANISRELSYNQKYISHVFKKHMGVGIAEYLNTIRIQSACTMMKQAFTNVSDIAGKCGYCDPQYFSKIFKEKMGVSPSAYIKSLQ